jgi:hypothetical protein
MPINAYREHAMRGPADDRPVEWWIHTFSWYPVLSSWRRVVGENQDESKWPLYRRRTRQGCYDGRQRGQ